MDNLIHWQACDEWVEVTNPITGKKDDMHITRKLVCDHPEIERCWFWGGGSPKDEKTHIMGFEILSKDGRRLSLSNVDPNCFETADIPEAEEWLRSLE